MTSKHFKQVLMAGTALLGSGCVAGEPSEEEKGAIIEQAIVVALPARIEAETYERSFDSTPAQNFGQGCNRNDGVDMQTTTDPNGGGCNVGWTTPGEWLEYDISTPNARSFNITSRVASAYSGKMFHLELDGANLGPLSAPTSGWQGFADRSYTNVNLSAGSHTLRVVFDSGDVNLNYIELSSNSASCQSAALPRTLAASSSSEGAGFVAAKAIDGNLGTRWSSAFSDPQWIYVDLGVTRRVNRVLLRWESAYSTNYDVEVSNTPKGPWTKVSGTTAGDGGNDDLSGFDAVGRYVRMYSRARKNQYGNSLWEFEVYGDNSPSCSAPAPTCSDAIKNGNESDVDCGGTACGKCANNKTCGAAGDCSSGYCSPTGVCVAAPTCSDGLKNGSETGVDCGGTCPACACGSQALTRSAAAASSVEGALYSAANAIDGSASTRWSSAFSDPQWLRVDLGATRFIGRVLINWQTAYSPEYDLEVSNGADGPWTKVYGTTAGDGGTDDVTGLIATGRYVRMFSKRRATQWGNSLFELQVFGDNNSTCTPSNPVTDADGDRLPDSVETGTGQFVSPTNTGTSPSNADTDNDGLPDGDEVLGTVAGLNLPAMGVSPVRKDILLEYDWFDDANECAAHSHRPPAGAIDRVTTAFANAPVTNPNGSTGITVIHDYGQGGVFTGGTVIADADGVIAGNVFGSDYQNYRAANFAVNRAGYFHYVLMPHRYDVSSTSSGYAEIFGDDMIVSLYCAGSVDSNVANTIMHELGHNLSLRHGGFEENNFKPNYNSVMNYEYQFAGVDSNCSQFGDGVLDFSRGQRIAIDETVLNETAGLCMSIPWDFDYRIPVPTNPNGAPPNGIQSYVYPLDITQDGQTAALFDYNDWANLLLDFAPSNAGLSLQALRLPQAYAECNNPAPMP